jgi:hypothetical protein
MADTFRALAAMSRGKKYKVVYKSDSQHYNREAVMVFMGTEGSSTSWDARPAAGTQTMPTSWIVGVVEVEEDARVYLNRRSSHQ